MSPVSGQRPNRLKSKPNGMFLIAFDHLISVGAVTGCIVNRMGSKPDEVSAGQNGRGNRGTSCYVSAFAAFQLTGQRPSKSGAQRRF